MATAPILDDDDLSPANDAGPLAMLAEIAQATGDISHMLDEQTLSRIGFDVVRDYDRDLSDRQSWEDVVRRAIKRAAQEPNLPENPPPYRRSHIDYPILTTAAQQFNARAYPAICKPGEMVKCKVVGSDKGRPQINRETGQPAMQPLPGWAPPPPDPAQPGAPPAQPPMVPVWQIPPGAKQARADRVSDYLNVYLEFRMDDWEEDTDLLLQQVPIVGCGFRKLWWDADQNKQCAAYIPALDLIVPQSAKSLKTTPRITERMGEVYPYQIRQRMLSGEYRTVALVQTEDDDEAPRELLEQHRFFDLDGDGVDEPYIVTVDKETRELLRIVANFGPDDVYFAEDGSVARIEREQFYIKYPFLPDPNGGFYDMGFGHLLEQMSDLVNASINQMLDAGHAQIAGGGFIASGLRLQSNNRAETMRWMPGEYKVVNASAADLRASIYERDFPAPSPILYQLLELMLGAARDITSVKDVAVGNAPNTAPVGTTLALIEGSLQVFTAIYKRVYRSLGQEYMMIFRSLSRYGGQTVAQDYATVLDDPAADFAKDFADADMDIKPVADPTAVTSQQRLAKAQVVLQTAQGNPLIDQKEALTRVFQAAGVENIDALFVPPPGPDPAMIADIGVKQSQIRLNDATAAQRGAAATKTGVEVGHQLGESEGLGGGVPALAGVAGNGVGGSGISSSGGSPAGGVGAGVVDAGGV